MHIESEIIMKYIDVLFELGNRDLIEKALKTS